MKGKAIHSLAAWIVCAIVLPAVAFAQDIRIRSGVAVIPGHPAREIRLRSVNDGPSALYDLQAVMETPWKTSESLVRPVWPAKEENRVVFTVSPAQEARGCFPVVVTLKFRDSTGIPVTLNDVATVSAGQGETSSGLGLSSAGTAFEIDGELEAHVQNPSDQSRTIRCRLVAPSSLAVSGAAVETLVKPGSSRPVRFHIMNRHAAAGTDVPVFVIAESDAGGIHSTTFIRTGTRILTAREARRPFRAVLWTILVLSGCYAAILFYRQSA